jgi:hypothetical protein
VAENKKIASCLQRWLNGAEWEDTPMFAALLTKTTEQRHRRQGLHDRDTVLARCAGYDAMYRQIQADGRLRTREELKPGNFREKGGVVIHLGRDAEPHLGSGNRRFAIAMALGLRCIPAMLGYVHHSAIVHLPALRRVPPGERTHVEAGPATTPCHGARG